MGKKTKFTKTIKLRLREPTTRKRERIEEAMKQSVIIANEAAKRMPGFPSRYIKKPKLRGSPFYGIVKDLRKDHVTINSSCAFQAVDKARQAYHAQHTKRMERRWERRWRETRLRRWREVLDGAKVEVDGHIVPARVRIPSHGNQRKARYRHIEDGPAVKERTLAEIRALISRFKRELRRLKKLRKVPKFKRMFVSLHKRDNIGKFFKKDGIFHVSLKLFPRERLVLPFAPGDYQEYFLQRIIGKKLDYGAGEIVKYNDFYSLNLTVKKEVDVDYEPETFIGADLGLNIIGWAVALDRRGNFLGEIHFDGKKAGHNRNRFFEKRKELQREGHLKLVRKIKDHESRWMENENRVVSRRITEFAKQFKNPVIVLEDINGREIRKRYGKSRIIHSWAHGQLRDFIMYKALEVGILSDMVSPEYTSQICPKCGHRAKGNRDSIRFKCLKCGYRNHADFVGAWNIAQKYMDNRVEKSNEKN